MSGDMITGMAWGVLFCLPAALVIGVWYWRDERKRCRGNNHREVFRIE